jgi:DNA repair ATPase RecN
LNVENIHLKTRAQQFEKEIDKKNKIIKSLISDIESGNAYNADNNIEASIVTSLKTELKYLHETIKTKINTYNELEIYLNNTTEEELKKEIEVLTKEGREIRRLIKNEVEGKRHEKFLNEVKKTEEKLQQQTNTLKNMKTEAEEFVALHKKKVIEIKRIKKQIERMETKQRDYLIQAKQFEKNKEVLEVAKKEIKDIKKQIKTISQMTQQSEAYQSSIEELMREQQELENEIEATNTEINSLEQSNKRKEYPLIKIKSAYHASNVPNI